MRITGVWMLALATALSAVAGPGSSQETGSIVGVVVSAETGQPLRGALLSLQGFGRKTAGLTSDDGTFRISGVPTGLRTLAVSLRGFRSESLDVDVARGGNRVRVELVRRPLERAAVRASVVAPDFSAAPETPRQSARDIALTLSDLPGVEAVRRGAVGLDPVVRGLRETQVGSYVDGVRVFSASPNRMDAPFTQLDPAAIAEVEILKGPYAVTWGAGTLSAIRVRTQPLPERGQDGAHGNLSIGYDTNLEAAETSGSIFGRQGRIAYWAFGAWRQTDDYEAGDGQNVEGRFESREGRAKLGLDTGESTQIVLAGGYREQDATDYPGLLLNTDHVEAVQASAVVDHSPTEGPVNHVDLRLYYSRVSQDLDNDGKPTAFDDPSRDPSAALYIAANPELEVWGGRLAIRLNAARGWEVELGGDLYSAHRQAVRKIQTRAEGERLFTDLLWPRSRITDGAPFIRLAGPVGSRVTVSGSLRTDFGKASADSLSDFFAENVASSFDETEVNWSGAVTVAVKLSQHWSMTLGAGTVSRIAGMNERFSDRMTSTRSQLTAEFIGDPSLEAERSNQADLWVEADYPGFHLYVNAFARRMDNYITVAPSAFERNLPLSPMNVFEYVNGEASFWGLEAATGLALNDRVSATFMGSYLWGRDDLLDEPAFGVAPLNGAATLRYEEPQGRYFVEGTVEGVTEKTDGNVGTTRGEAATGGYALGSVMAGASLSDGISLTLGVKNLWDESYIDHLNARNPFTGARIPEVGRVLFARLAYAF